jgi:hypothetical protein
MYIHVMTRFFVFVFLISTINSVSGQQKERPLPPNINQPSINLYAPFVSGNGKALVYLSDYTDDGSHSMYFASREGFEWNDGKEINKLVNRPSLNFRGGYSLDHTGQRLFVTSRKSGLGGYNIWVSERNGNDWHKPQNLGSPLNSRENEGSPVLTTDGETMYFMRCSTMNAYKASGCRIMVSRLRHGRWSEPENLPSNINTGNSQFPRILGDGETLVFSSDKFGGKGDLDLYMSQKTGSGWTDPVPLDFINSESNDAFISIPVKGRYVYLSRKGRRNYELVERIIPESLRPDRVMRITGKVETDGPANLLVFNLDDRSRLWNETIENNGRFSIVLKEGSTYDISVSNGKPGYGYFSEVLSLEEIGRIDRRSYDIELSPMQYGDTISGKVVFEEQTIPEKYTFELRRIAGFIRQNPNSRVTLEIHQEAYEEDSVAREELTEIRLDTIFTPPKDTLIMDPLKIKNRRIIAGLDSIDVVLPSGDSLRYTSEWIGVDTVYHNDRTEKLERLVRQFMQSRGLDSLDYKVIRILTPRPIPRAQEFGMDREDDNQKKSSNTERLVAILRE